MPHFGKTFKIKIKIAKITGIIVQKIHKIFIMFHLIRETLALKLVLVQINIRLFIKITILFLVLVFGDK